jgi:exonuclease SbcD
MKLIHTSDWHLGRGLYEKKRYEEHEKFLDWLASRIAETAPELLIIAGDVFDTGTPSNRARELYYRFLCRMASSPCRHVVVVGGNHDSPSFLNAPRELLRVLNVHVVGSLPDFPEEEVLVLRNASGEPEALCCAVPYIRDRDVRLAEEGEDFAAREEKLLGGIREHYARICEEARRVRKNLEAELGRKIPLVVTGHLFAAGGMVHEGDGVRELYVGSLPRVGGECFPEDVDYVALGHLHAPQVVGGNLLRRYSGAPLPMSFGEPSGKCVVEVDFSGEIPRVTEVPVPSFQKLARISGTLEEIEEKLDSLAGEGESCWIEVECRDVAGGSVLRERLEERIAGRPLEILRIRTPLDLSRSLGVLSEEECLAELDPEEVFGRCLEAHHIPEEERPRKMNLFRGALRDMREEDLRAE